ncbi:MAG: DUF2185 domain-containing protein [Pseudomonadota bacterium]
MSDQSKQRWWLEDASAIAEQAPYTFWLPSDAIIAKLAPGNQVKLIFVFDSDDPEAPRAERMWVDVRERNGTLFRGLLDNEPKYMTGISHGDSLEFAPNHIVDTDIFDPTSADFERYFQRCFVTDRIMKDRVKVGYVYREAPDREDDSGWRFLAGDESEEYMDDASNTNYIAVGSVLNLDSTLVELIDEPVGQWAWDSEAGAWHRLENEG